MIGRETVEKTIGKGFADKLDEFIFEVSQDLSYSRREMVDELGCANFIAAARLAKVLRKLKIYTPGQLHRLDPFSLARSKGIGESALFVAMCILEAKGYDVEKWWGWKGTNVVKFSTFKSHAMAKARRHKQEVA